MRLLDYSVITFLVVAVITLFVLFGRYIYRETVEFTPMSKQIEKDTRCKYLGHPHARMELGYFDCGNEIIIKRVSK